MMNLVSSGESGIPRNNDNNEIEGWATLLIGGGIVCALVGIGIIFVCTRTNYKLVANRHNNQDNRYRLMTA